jgi:hypothetical protein
MDYERIGPVTTGVVVGGLLYIGLNWIPVVGPLIAGAIAGYIAKGRVFDGFRTGVIAGIVGFIGVIFVMAQMGLLNTTGVGVVLTGLILWIILVWNLTAIFFMGVGGAVGSLAASTRSFFKPMEARFKAVKSYRICPRCGSSYPGSDKDCRCVNA